MYDQPVNPSDEKPMPVCRIVVSKDDASKMKVGSDVTIDVSGKVKSLHPDFNDKEMYEVEIEDPKCEVEQNENEADDNDDENMATMPREKLKQKLMQPDEE